MSDEEYFKELEKEINFQLRGHLKVSYDSATQIINMVSSICSTRGAALYHIENYLNKHFN
jgi:hypothetical protein